MNRTIELGYHKKLTTPLRMLSADMIEKAKSGHPGMPLGFSDVVSVLYQCFLSFHPKDPRWPNRDRIIFSAGHGSALLYSLLYLTGYDKITIEDLKNFRQLNSKTPGHPEIDIDSGIETTTGPLGQGLANAVGMAISERILNSRLGDDVINHKIYAIVGDGCLMEGISHEAISLAGHLKLKNLIVLFDDNGISIDGKTNLTTSDKHLLRFSACNWETISVDGHNPTDIYKALKMAQKAEKPFFIAFKTQIGFGSPNKVNSEKSHGAPLGAEEVKLMKKNYNWNHPEFTVPKELLYEWRNFYLRNEPNYKTWQSNSKQIYLDFIKQLSNENLIKELQKLKEKYNNNPVTTATRKISGEIINTLTSNSNNFIGGSCDLSGSNNTKSPTHQPIQADSFNGTYIHYGVREQGMVAIMNGISLHSSLRTYGGTFLIFSDYARPSIRLTSMMKIPAIFIMTHDSIGVGEDGPTHQPIEQLASLRCIPNLMVFRPCDGLETIECWELAIKSDKTPSLIALSRQNIPQLRHNHHSDIQENLCSKGAYILTETNNNPDVIIFATGSEVSIANEVKLKLEAKNISVRLVSVPCFELFFNQPLEYQKSVTCDKAFKVAIEAGVEQPWNKLIGHNGLFFGLDSFGKSAPGEQVYDFFNLKSDIIADKIVDTIKS